MNDPYKRTQWSPGATWTAAARPGGRTGPGARNHCAHGKGVAVETVLDWRPFDYFTSETREGSLVTIETIQLEPLPEGDKTRVHDRIRMSMRLPRWLRRQICKFMMRMMNKYDKILTNSARLLAEELARELPAGDRARA